MNDPANIDADVACDLSINDLATDQEAWEERVQRTDASLEAWRRVAAERRVAWEAAQAAAAERLAEFKQLWARRASAVAGVLAALLLAFVAWRLPEPTDPEVAEGSVTLEAPPVASKVAERPVPLVTVPLLPPAVPVVRGTTRVWQDRRYQWVEFMVGVEEPTWMRWRDGNGRVVLDDMLCFKAQTDEHRCLAGRGLARIEASVAAGATPGTWTVDVCSESGCTTATSFQVRG